MTFDSGGISIKPSDGMHEMKMDMSGGAAVIEAIAAIAELGLALDLVAAVPATENMPSGTAVKPGDIIEQLNGKTVEVNNTDAEGRLILADALTYCVRELGAERLVDIATLTGAVVIALGSTYAALISNDDEWAAAVEEAASASGELVWRLPLHPEYKELTKGTIADLTNAAAKRKAGTIYAGSFLEEFTDDVPWAHLDIAGTAWGSGRAYVGDGASGFGVRLLVRLARARRLTTAGEWPKRRVWDESTRALLEDHAGGRAVGEQLAGRRVGEPRLAGRLAAAAVDHLTLGADPLDLAGDRADHLHLEAERRVADPGRQRRVDGAAERRVEQRRRVAAVDDADRVEVLLAGLALEDRPARLELDRLHPQQDGDRRRRQLTRGERPDVLEAGHAGAGLGGRDRVLPGDEPLAGRFRARRACSSAASVEVVVIVPPRPAPDHWGQGRGSSGRRGSRRC